MLSILSLTPTGVDMSVCLRGAWRTGGLFPGDDPTAKTQRILDEQGTDAAEHRVSPRR